MSDLNKDFGVSDFLVACMQGGAVLSSLEWTDGTWTDPTTELVEYVTGIADLKLSGIKIVFATRNLTFDMKMELIDAFGDVDDINNNVYAEYNKVAISSISITGQTFMSRPGKYELSVQAEPAGGNDFKSIAWSLDNTVNAEIDQKGVVMVKTVSSTEEGAHGTVTCVTTLTDGTEVTASFELKFYARGVQVGDYVLSDGTTSESQYPQSGLTAIGRVFYVNPDNPKDRRMVSLGLWSADTWGITSGDNVVLADNPAYHTADIAALPDEWQSKIDVMSDGVPLGKYYTKLIIVHRNTILKDSGINLPVPEEQTEQDGGSVMDHLNTDMANAYQKGEALRRYYYPAASLCYSYQPSVGKNEVLDDRFKAGQWYLPTVAELSAMRAIIGGSDTLWSCCEYNADRACYVRMSDGLTNFNYKSYSYVVRAVAAF